MILKYKINKDGMINIIKPVKTFYIANNWILNHTVAEMNSLK